MMICSALSSKSLLFLCFFLDHPFFLAVQFHPEFLSRPLKPSPPYLGFILASLGKLDGYISRGGRLSPQSSFHEFEPIDEAIRSASPLLASGSGVSPSPLESS